MDWLQFVWDWLLPATENILLRGQAGLVIAACLGLALAALALVVTWAITGDLLRQTVLATALLALILIGIGALAREGWVTLAAGALVILLTLIITSIVATYGLGSISASGYVLPIVLATCAVGLWAGLFVALTSAATLWILAWGERAGWRRPLLPTHIHHLTFNAPALTVLFLLTALMGGVWTGYVIRLLSP
jgi:hypothetical protein